MQIRTAALCIKLLVVGVICLSQNPQLWVQIFDGKSLTGWKNIGQEKWVVEDGVIYGEGVTGGYGYPATEKTYKDIHLSLRFKCEASGNSGVFYHTRWEGDPPRLRGI